MGVESNLTSYKFYIVSMQTLYLVIWNKSPSNHQRHSSRNSLSSFSIILYQRVLPASSQTHKLIVIPWFGTLSIKSNKFVGQPPQMWIAGYTIYIHFNASETPVVNASMEKWNLCIHVRYKVVTPNRIRLSLLIYNINVYKEKLYVYRHVYIFLNVIWYCINR